MAATITAIAFQVTGISDKINRAAANVFGEDLVKVANIAGTVFAAYNGGFSFDSAADAASTGAEALNGYDVMSDAASTAAESASQGASAMNGYDVMSDQAAASSSGAPTDGLNGYDVQSDIASAAPQTQTGSVNLSDLQKQEIMDPAKVQAPEPPKFEMSGAAAERVPTSADYAQGGPSTGMKNVTDAGPGFFEKLQKMVTNKDGTITNGALQLGGNILQGAFGGYSAAKAREQQQAQYEAAVARQARLANLGTAGWRQTQ